MADVKLHKRKFLEEVDFELRGVTELGLVSAISTSEAGVNSRLCDAAAEEGATDVYGVDYRLSTVSIITDSLTNPPKTKIITTILAFGDAYKPNS